MTNTDILYCSDDMKEKHNNSISQDFEIHRDLEVKFVENGIIHPMEIPVNGVREDNNYGGVTDSDLNFIELSLNKRARGESLTDYKQMYIGANPNYDFNNINYVDEDVIFLGPLHHFISHFYLETFSRFWILLEEKYKNHKVAFLIMPNEKIYDYHREFIELIGLKPEQIIYIEKPTKFKNVIIPEQSLSLHKCFHRVYGKLFDKISENIEPLNYKKVYFSKTGDTYRFIPSLNEPLPKTCGSEMMDKLFEQNGYKVMYPEKMSIKETIAALKNCDEFVAQSGSNAHNGIFLKDGAKIIILNRSEHIHPLQTMINDLKNLKVTYVDTFFENLPNSWSTGPYAFLITDYMKQFMDNKQFKYDKKSLQKKSKSVLREFLKTYYYFYKEIYPDELTNKSFDIKFILDLLISVSDLCKDDGFKFFDVKKTYGKTIYKICGIKFTVKHK